MTIKPDQWIETGGLRSQAKNNIRKYINETPRRVWGRFRIKSSEGLKCIS